MGDEATNSESYYQLADHSRELFNGARGIQTKELDTVSNGRCNGCIYSWTCLSQSLDDLIVRGAAKNWKLYNLRDIWRAVDHREKAI